MIFADDHESTGSREAVVDNYSAKEVYDFIVLLENFVKEYNFSNKRFNIEVWNEDFLPKVKKIIRFPAGFDELPVFQQKQVIIRVLVEVNQDIEKIFINTFSPEQINGIRALIENRIDTLTVINTDADSVDRLQKNSQKLIEIHGLDGTKKEWKKVIECFLQVMAGEDVNESKYKKEVQNFQKMNMGDQRLRILTVIDDLRDREEKHGTKSTKLIEQIDLIRRSVELSFGYSYSEYLEQIPTRALLTKAFRYLKGLTDNQTSRNVISRAGEGTSHFTIKFGINFVNQLLTGKRLKEALRSFWSYRVGQARWNEKSKKLEYARDLADKFLSESDCAKFLVESWDAKEETQDIDTAAESYSSSEGRRDDVLYQNAYEHALNIYALLYNSIREKTNDQGIVETELLLDKDPKSQPRSHLLSRRTSRASEIVVSCDFYGSLHKLRFEVDFQQKKLPNFKKIVELFYELEKRKDGKKPDQPLHYVSSSARLRMRDLSLQPDAKSQEKDPLLGQFVDAHFAYTIRNADSQKTTELHELITGGRHLRAHLMTETVMGLTVPDRQKKSSWAFSHPWFNGMPAVNFGIMHRITRSKLLAADQLNDENDLDVRLQEITIGRDEEKKGKHTRQSFGQRREFLVRKDFSITEAEKFYQGWKEVNFVLKEGSLKRFGLSISPQEYLALAMCLLGPRSFSIILGEIGGDPKSLENIFINMSSDWILSFQKYIQSLSDIPDRSVINNLIAQFVEMMVTTPSSEGYVEEKLRAQRGCGTGSLLAMSTGKFEKPTTIVAKAVLSREYAERVTIIGGMLSSFVFGARKTADVRVEMLINELTSGESKANKKDLYRVIYVACQQKNLSHAMMILNGVFDISEISSIQQLKVTLQKFLVEDEGVTRSQARWITDGFPKVSVCTANAGSYGLDEKRDRPIVQGSSMIHRQLGVFSMSTFGSIEVGDDIHENIELTERYSSRQIDTQRVVNKFILYMIPNKFRSERLVNLVSNDLIGYLDAISDFQNASKYRLIADLHIVRLVEELKLIGIVKTEGEIMIEIENILQEEGKIDIENILYATEFLKIVFRNYEKNQQ